MQLEDMLAYKVAMLASDLSESLSKEYSEYKEVHLEQKTAPNPDLSHTTLPEVQIDTPVEASV